MISHIIPNPAEKNKKFVDFWGQPKIFSENTCISAENCI